MIIFGLGLPRTGTNSLGLHLLNINGECKCILNDYNNKRDKTNNINYLKYIIYNDAFRDLDTILSNEIINENKFILTIRNNEDWLKSIENFNELKELNQITYKNKIEKIFKDKKLENRLLIINLFEDDDEKIWKNYIKFLELDLEDYQNVIEEKFPKINLNK
jgi:hypothetical protein